MQAYKAELEEVRELELDAIKEARFVTYGNHFFSGIMLLISRTASRSVCVRKDGVMNLT